MTERLFGTDGIRGVAGREPLTPGGMIQIGQAAAAVLGHENSSNSGPSAVIGRDTRISGEYLEAALAAALAASGVRVLSASVIPTPAVAMLTHTLGASFGAVISASHNPFSDNGIKFFGADGTKISDPQEAAIEEFINLRKTPGSAHLPGRIEIVPDALARYADFAVSTLAAGFSLRGWKIALDLANGAAYRSTPAILERLGADLIIQADAPDGRNINERCGSTFPSTIESLQKSSGAQVGLAHDGDADRLLLCDEMGNSLDGDELLAIAATFLLRRKGLRHGLVVATVMSNYALDELIRSEGGQLIRTPVGDRHVFSALQSSNAMLGGEQSGHLIFRDLATTGDGIISALQIFRIMQETGKPLSELRRVLQKYPQTQRAVLVKKKLPWDQIPELQQSILEAERALSGKGRLVVRYSGTEPKLRILIEGPDEKMLARLADELEIAVKKHLA